MANLRSQKEEVKGQARAQEGIGAEGASGPTTCTPNHGPTRSHMFWSIIMKGNNGDTWSATNTLINK
eukprot:11440444-Prorocentrum_lima.AAC.1